MANLWQHTFCSVTHPYVYLLRYQGSHGLWLQRQVPQQLQNWRCAQLRVPIATHGYLENYCEKVPWNDSLRATIISDIVHSEMQV